MKLVYCKAPAPAGASFVTCGMHHEVKFRPFKYHILVRNWFIV